jgi:hypothetical protein
MTQNNWTMMNASIPAKQAFAVKVPDAEYSEYNKSLSYYTTEMASALDPNMKELLPAVMNQLRSEYAIGECYSMYEPVNLSDGSCAERYAYENAVRRLAQPKDWVYLSLPIYNLCEHYVDGAHIYFWHKRNCPTWSKSRQSNRSGRR